MNAPLRPQPVNTTPSTTDPRNRAAEADRDLRAGSRAAAAQRALVAVDPAPEPTWSNAPPELARLVIEPSSLNLDVDHVGEELHVFAARVELVNRTGQPIRALPRDQLTAVKVRKRLKTATLTIRSSDAGTITMKGLDPADAESVRDELLGLTQTPAKASAALAHLDALAAAGLLDDKDLATKRAQVMRPGPTR